MGRSDYAMDEGLGTCGAGYLRQLPVSEVEVGGGEWWDDYSQPLIPP